MGGGMSFVKDAPWQSNMIKTNSVNIGPHNPGIIIPLANNRRNPNTLSSGSSVPAGSKQFQYPIPRRGTGNVGDLSPSDSLGNTNFKTTNS
jgi:hypothetical protein